MNNKGPSCHSGNSKSFGRSVPRTMGKDQIYIFIILQLVKALEPWVWGEDRMRQSIVWIWVLCLGISGLKSTFWEESRAK